MTPKEIAADIVERFSWSTNVMRDGRLVGQQHIVADAIAEAIAKERAAIEALQNDLAEIARLRLATSEGTLRVRADRMWEIATGGGAR